MDDRISIQPAPQLTIGAFAFCLCVSFSFCPPTLTLFYPTIPYPTQCLAVNLPDPTPRHPPSRRRPGQGRAPSGAAHTYTYRMSHARHSASSHISKTYTWTPDTCCTATLHARTTKGPSSPCPSRGTSGTRRFRHPTAATWRS